MNRKTIIRTSLKVTAIILLVAWYVLFGRDLAKGSMSGVALIGLFVTALIYEIGARFNSK